MKYLKLQASVPVAAIEKLKGDNLSANVEDAIKKYINEPLEPLPPGIKTTTVFLSLSYDTIKEIKEKRRERVKDYIRLALYKHLKETEDG